MNKKPTAATIARTIILALALINGALAITGKSPLPIGDDQVVEMVSYVAAAAASLTAWWKNNSFTQRAIAADEQYDLG